MKLILIAALLIAPVLAAAWKSQEDLDKAAQNPIASLISVPIEGSNKFDWGPEGELFSVNDIQPVIPFDLNDDKSLTL